MMDPRKVSAIVGLIEHRYRVSDTRSAGLIGYRSPVTTGSPTGVHVIVTVPCSSVRQTSAPVTATSPSATGSGCPYGFGCPTLIATTSGVTAGKNSASDVSPPWCGISSEQHRPSAVVQEHHDRVVVRVGV